MLLLVAATAVKLHAAVLCVTARVVTANSVLSVQPGSAIRIELPTENALLVPCIRTVTGEARRPAVGAYASWTRYGPTWAVAGEAVMVVRGTSVYLAMVIPI